MRTGILCFWRVLLTKYYSWLDFAFMMFSNKHLNIFLHKETFKLAFVLHPWELWLCSKALEHAFLKEKLLFVRIVLFTCFFNRIFLMVLSQVIIIFCNFLILEFDHGLAHLASTVQVFPIHFFNFPISFLQELLIEKGFFS